MGKEKRMIGDYTVLCSVNVGEKEVILASNEQSMDGETFLCGFVERNDLFELCKEALCSAPIFIPGKTPDMKEWMLWAK